MKNTAQAAAKLRFSEICSSLADTVTLRVPVRREGMCVPGGCKIPSSRNVLRKADLPKRLSISRFQSAEVVELADTPS
jgi:hypothetical protein